MASSYTSNNAIEKIGTGEQAGTWGSTTNTNFDIIDRAINGVGAITLSGTTHTLTTSDGTVSDGHFKVLVFGGSPSGTNTVTIDPNNQDKLYFIKNNTSQSIIIKQGTGDTVTIAATKTAIVYADGAGSGAAVAQIETGSDSFTEDLTVKTSDGALLTLQTSDTTITDGDVLGALQFQAPNEGSGTDAITVSASIVAEADNTFAEDNNQTDMVFKLGSSEAATEKMRLTHEGDLTVSTSFTIGSATITEAELEILDGATVTTAELNILDGVTSTAAELNLLDGSTAGTVVASKAVVVDGNKDASGFRNVTATGTVQGAEVTATSDERLKSDIKTIDNALYKVMNMRGVSFTKQAEKGIGVIAQEVEKIIPEVVTDGEYKSVAYGNMVGVLIEAIKDLKKELDEHKQGCNCGS